MSETAEAERDAWRCRHRLLAEQFREAGVRIRELEWALDESVKLQSHYAVLLNIHDGGKRLTFESADAWLMRLRELAAKGRARMRGGKK